MIIEVPAEILKTGRTVTIEQTDFSEEGTPAVNVADLYNTHHLHRRSNVMEMHIRIPTRCIERDNTILIQKENISVMKSEEYEKGQAHRLSNNRFAKRDHLQQKSILALEFAWTRK